MNAEQRKFKKVIKRRKVRKNHLKAYKTTSKKIKIELSKPNSSIVKKIAKALKLKKKE